MRFQLANLPWLMQFGGRDQLELRDAAYLHQLKRMWELVDQLWSTMGISDGDGGYMVKFFSNTQNCKPSWLHILHKIQAALQSLSAVFKRLWNEKHTKWEIKVCKNLNFSATLLGLSLKYLLRIVEESLLRKYSMNVTELSLSAVLSIWHCTSAQLWCSLEGFSDFIGQIGCLII